MSHPQACGARQYALQRPALLNSTDKGEPQRETAMLEDGPGTSAAVGTGAVAICEGGPRHTHGNVRRGPSPQGAAIGAAGVTGRLRGREDSSRPVRRGHGCPGAVSRATERRLSQDSAPRSETRGVLENAPSPGRAPERECQYGACACSDEVPASPEQADMGIGRASDPNGDAGSVGSVRARRGGAGKK